MAVFPHGQDEVRASFICHRDEAAEYCTLLVRELDRRWGRAQRSGDDEVGEPEGTTPEETERGPKAGTLERVAKAHRLIRDERLSRNKAFKRAKTDSRTYDQWCKLATGEEPIEAYNS